MHSAEPVATHVPHRATQGFVANVSWAWRHPSLSLLEIAWRWAFGAPALWLLWRAGSRVLREVPWQTTGVQHISANQLLTDPMAAALAVSQLAVMVTPHLIGPATHLLPLLVVAWIVVSAAGRTLVLRRMDRALQPRFPTLLLLQAVRVLLSVLIAWVWWKGVEGLAALTIGGPIAAGHEPSMVAYAGGTIALTLGLFVLAGGVSWVFAAAPIVAMRDGLGAWGSLRGAAKAHGVRGSMAEINLVLSVVKVMLVVLAMAFSAFPLPFSSIMTQQYVLIWSVLVGLWYFAASDFFHVTRLHAFTHLLRDGRG